MRAIIMKPTTNRTFRTWFGSVVTLGVMLVGLAFYRALGQQPSGLPLVLAGLAFVAGSFSLKLPGMNGRVSAGDAIICLCILLFGPYAGAIAGACDGAGGSLRCRSSRRRASFMLYNASATAISAFVAGHAFYTLLGNLPLFGQSPVPAASLMLPLCVLSATYYLINTALAAAAVALEKSVTFYRVWRDGFAWTCVNYLAGAFAAGILAEFANPLSPTVLGALLFTCAGVYVSCRAHVILTRKVQGGQETSLPPAAAA
jgi:hypothetical protein